RREGLWAPCESGCLHDRGEHVADAPCAPDVVSPHDATAEGDAERGRREGGLVAFVDLELEKTAQERLVGRRQQQRIAEVGESGRRAEQLEGLLPGLAQIEASVEHDALFRDPSFFGPCRTVEEEVGYGGHDV